MIINRIRKKRQEKRYRAQIQAFYLHHKEYLKENEMFYSRLPAFQGCIKRAFLKKTTEPAAMKAIKVSDILEQLKGCENYNVTFSFDKNLGEQVYVKPHSRTVNINIPEPPTFSATFPTVSDKDVKEIAKMQQQIDTFKAALLHARERILLGNKCDMVVIDPLDDCDKHLIKTIFKFIDEHTTTA